MMDRPRRKWTWTLIGLTPEQFLGLYLEEGRQAGRKGRGSQKFLRGLPALSSPALSHSTGVSVTQITPRSYQQAEKYERKELFSPLHSQLTSQPKVNLCSGFLCPFATDLLSGMFVHLAWNTWLKLAEEEGRPGSERTGGLCSLSGIPVPWEEAGGGARWSGEGPPPSWQGPPSAVAGTLSLPQCWGCRTGRW